MEFFEALSGFLIHPKNQVNKLIKSGDYSEHFKKMIIFIIYISTFSSISLVFFILYPECVYYGIERYDYNNLFFITLSQPINLLILFLFGLILNFGIYFLLFGLINYLTVVILSENKFNLKQYKEYLSIYGFSLEPFLILSSVLIFWYYFIEKLYLATEIPPFIDFTIHNIILIAIFIGILIWRFVIIFRINQVFFKISSIRAVIPCIIEIISIILILALVGFIIVSISGNITLV